MSPTLMLPPINQCSIADDPVAFSGARIFDGKRTVADRAVLVKDGLVLDVVPCDSVPGAVPHYRDQDCTVLPGLIDTHVHFMRRPMTLSVGAAPTLPMR